MSKKVGLGALLVFLAASSVAGWIGWKRFESYSTRSRLPESDSSKATREQSFSKPAAPSIHIDGCKSYLAPPNDEKLEPRVLPGASIEDLRRVYGPETNFDSTVEKWEWQSEAFNLRRWGIRNEDKAESIGIDINPGNIVATPDGIELGRDTFSTVLQKMKDRGVPVSEYMEGADGTWILFVSFSSTCDPQDWSEYTWYLDGTPAVENAIGNEIPFRSNIFLQEVVKNYEIEAGKEPSGEIEGQPSVHD